jgi:membrane-bound lytic murein transglycosylase D
MKRSRPIWLILLFCCLYLPSSTFTGQMPIALPAALASVAPEASAPTDSSYVAENSDIPMGLLELMRASRSKYLEGSVLIKSGESDKARENFNKAVDLLLQSNWDLASTPALNRFFQDLIQRIQQDESRYLVAPFGTDEEGESAILDELDNLDFIPITGDSALASVLSADELAKTKYDIPITVNDMVLKSLDYWLNHGRKYFADGLQRSGQYRPMIERVFREESVPLDLMYLAQVESLFKPHAVSKAKAKGIWQFEKGTAIRYGLKVTRDVDERSDPEKSTRAAARYLNDLFAMFKDWNLALAAYNWGEGKVQRLVNNTGLTDFWQLVDLKRRLPAETKNHVPLIQASVILARNAERYGLPTELDPPLRYTEVSVSKPVDLRAAAKILSTSLEELKKLNPSLRGNTTPANYPNFQLKVPSESSPEIENQLASLPTVKIKPPLESGCRHKILKGETLTSIASRYHLRVDDVRKANDFSAKKVLIAGTSIALPSCQNDQEKASIAKGTSTKAKPANLPEKKASAKKAQTAQSKSVASKGTGSKTGSKTRSADSRIASLK